MKRRNWLTNAMFSKLSDISQVVKEKFGDNNDGRGHWEEIELMRRLFHMVMLQIKDFLLN